tara:strand:+ start:174 stop:428 length:255 start_codon:yes stop_codon:yes gene_type:complete
VTPKAIQLDGTNYLVKPPTGRDYISSLDLDDFGKACFFILRCVFIESNPAFKTIEEVQDQPMAILLKLESVVSSLLEYDIPDPT